MQVFNNPKSWLVVIVFVLVCNGAVSAQNLNMDFKEAPLSDVFTVLGELAGYNVLIDPSVNEKVSFYLKDLTVQEALELISRTTDYGYEIVNNTLIAASHERLANEFESAEFVFVVLENIDVKDAGQLVQVVVPRIKSYQDHNHNLLVLYGTKQDVKDARALLAQYDAIGSKFQQPQEGVKPEPEIVYVEVPVLTEDIAEPMTSYRIAISYGDGAQILSYIQQLYPNRQFVWNNQLKILSGVTTAAEWAEISQIVTDADLPNFTIKGIITSGERTLVLVGYHDSTNTVALGDLISGWVVTNVTDKQVTFTQDDRNFTVTLGR